jgi:quercetin dioxygenase-like cupin family protein
MPTVQPFAAGGYRFIGHQFQYSGGVMEAAMTDPSYAVKNIEAIAEGSDMRARLYTLAPGDVIPWHYHTAVTDWYFCLAGILRVETRAPRGDERLAAGAHYQIPPKTAHRISNGGGEECQFLLLQGVGAGSARRYRASRPGTASTSCSKA